MIVIILVIGILCLMIWLVLLTLVVMKSNREIGRIRQELDSARAESDRPMTFEEARRNKA